MDRRNFIRIAGGGVVVAAALATASCTTEPMPAGAVAPWEGPGQQTDVRRWILSYAILAPNSHNIQPWLIDLSTPDEILLRCDLTRLLTESDPFSRQTMMSHGTFLELLDLAARERGLRADISLFPEGQFVRASIDARPVARIRLVADSAVKPDPLFAQILHRRTNRSEFYPHRAIPQEAVLAMAENVKFKSLQFGFVGLAQPERLQLHRLLAEQAWRVELTTPRVMMETYGVLRVGAKEIDQHRDGLFVLDRLPVFLNQIGLFNRRKVPGPDDYVITSQIKDFSAKLESTPAFLWIISDDNDRSTQINAGRSYVRVQLAATALGIAMQPLSQALEEYPEQVVAFAEIRALLNMSGSSQTVQMWARLGFGPTVGPAPRRGVDAQLVKV